MKQNGSSDALAKHKRKRGAGQSTHLRKNSVTAGIIIQRANADA